MVKHWQCKALDGTRDHYTDFPRIGNLLAFTMLPDMIQAMNKSSPGREAAPLLPEGTVSGGMSVALELGIHQGDCVQKLAELPPGSVQLAFADPPFNIGYKYDVYDDRQGYEQYLEWSRQWMRGVERALSPTGTFWLAIGDEYAAELKLIAQNELGLTCRSWVIWYYTFGVNCTKKFNRSHAHLFHFVKDGRIGHFTFNAADPAVRVPSARQLVYADGRANPDGRLPDDTWILRPQDLPDGFSTEQDTWYFPRVAGTFKERAGFHGCQMPEQLLGRIIRISSNEGDYVLDPFGGSGTTLVVAKKLNRKHLGFELSKDYAAKIKARLESVKVGQPLDGSAEPLKSAPATVVPRASRNGHRAIDAATSPTLRLKALIGYHRFDPSQLKEHSASLLKAFAGAGDGYSADYVLADPDINASFISACEKAGLPGAPPNWNHYILNLRKSGKLPTAKKRVAVQLDEKAIDACGFASEIALRELTADARVSLDDVLCDPELARRFDELAGAIAPGFAPVQLRWAALRIRKGRKDVEEAAEAIDLETVRTQMKQRRWRSLSELAAEGTKEDCAIYLLRPRKGQCLYIGETDCLQRRLELHLRTSNAIGVEEIRVIPYGDSSMLRRATQAKLVQEQLPPLNLRLLAAS